jgi:hypothetical protein
LAAVGDPVEILLQLGGEVVVDQPAEVLLQVTAKASQDGTRAAPRCVTYSRSTITEIVEA